MGIHHWWLGLGCEVGVDDLASPPAQALAAALNAGMIQGATLIAIRQTPDRSISAVHMEIDVERPQDLAYPIQATEPVVAAFSATHSYPSVFAIRDGFPDTPHQNWVPEGFPCSLCVDDRPWAEARLTWSVPGFVRQIQQWLAKTSRGELHETGRPVEPLFFGTPYSLVVPRQILRQDPNDLIELIGYQPADGDGRIIISELSDAAVGPTQAPGRFAVLRFRAAPPADVGPAPRARDTCRAGRCRSSARA